MTRKMPLLLRCVIRSYWLWSYKSLVWEVQRTEMIQKNPLFTCIRWSEIKLSSIVWSLRWKHPFRRCSKVSLAYGCSVARYDHYLDLRSFGRCDRYWNDHYSRRQRCSNWCRASCWIDCFDFSNLNCPNFYHHCPKSFVDYWSFCYFPADQNCWHFSKIHSNQSHRRNCCWWVDLSREASCQNWELSHSNCTIDCQNFDCWAVSSFASSYHFLSNDLQELNIICLEMTQPNGYFKEIFYLFGNHCAYFDFCRAYYCHVQKYCCFHCDRTDAFDYFRLTEMNFGHRICDPRHFALHFSSFAVPCYGISQCI